MSFTETQGGITAPKGFLAAGVHAGIRKNKTKKDMAMVVSVAPAAVAGAFTKNTMAAAPVLWNRELVARGTAQALVVNSGVANACTGEQGLADVAETATFAGKLLSIEPDMVAVASTGIIGKPLPMDNIKSGISDLAENLSDTRVSAGDAAEAILTTDTFVKELAYTLDVDGTLVTVGGMAKGSAMIHPNMGTILAFIATDLNISQELLQQIISEAVEESFNMLSVDGATSTNDSVMIFANGMAKNAEITEDHPAYATFVQAVKSMCINFVEQIATGDEGRDIAFKVNVSGAETDAVAKTFAKAVVESNLVKESVGCGDVNWGRIICAMGGTGVEFVLDGVKVSHRRDELLHIDIELNGGCGRACAWGSAKHIEL